MQTDDSQIHFSQKVSGQILGLWNLDVSPVSIGGLLIFAEELELLRTIHHAETINYLFFSSSFEKVHILSPVSHEARGPVLIESQASISAILLKTLSHTGATYCWHTVTEASLAKYLGQSSAIHWPVSAQASTDHPYCTTIALQELLQKYRGKISKVPLTATQELSLWADQFWAEYGAGRCCVAVHLRHTPESPVGNAKQEEWAQFFSQVQSAHRAFFVLIGTDPILQCAMNAPNVLCSKDKNLSLAQDLALISRAHLFMGLASGPCQMAMFGHTPYLIIKHPDHHAQQMELEFPAGRFPFGGKYQIFLRDFETADTLFAQFEHLIRFYSIEERKRWAHKSHASR